MLVEGGGGGACVCKGCWLAVMVLGSGTCRGTGAPFLSEAESSLREECSRLF